MPVVAVVIGGLGAAVVVRWVVKEGRRVNALLRAKREAEANAVPERLRRDAGGVYRRQDSSIQ
jgi:hypothetical protein